MYNEMKMVATCCEGGNAPCSGGNLRIYVPLCDESHTLVAQYGNPYEGYKGFPCDLCKRVVDEDEMEKGFMRCESGCIYDVCTDCMPVLEWSLQ